RNTDSSTVPTSPYTSTGTYFGGGYLRDTGSWNTSVLDSMISIHYYACGQWNTIDTFFNIYMYPPDTFAYLSFNIQLPCLQPCDASFSSYLAGNNYVYAYPTQTAGRFNHQWDMGDGNTLYGSYVYH